MKTLIICEKPSQAEAVVNAVAPNTKKSNGYFENDNYIVCNAVGHLMTIDDSKLSEKWTTIPYLFDPTKDPIYNYKIDSKTKKQYDLIEKLLKRNDIFEIINACDPDAEGEAIYRTIIEYKWKRHQRYIND